MFDAGSLIRKVLIAIVSTTITVSPAQSAELPPGAVPVPRGFVKVPKPVIEPTPPLPTDFQKGEIIDETLENAGSISFDVTIAELEQSGFECVSLAYDHQTSCHTADARSFSLLGRPATVRVVFHKGLFYFVEYTIPGSHKEVKGALTEVFGKPFTRVAFRGEPLDPAGQYTAWIFKKGGIVDIHAWPSKQEVEIGFYSALYSFREYKKQYQAFGLEPFDLEALDISDL
jgi:hypothetical protein